MSFDPLKALEGAERAASVLRAFGPVAEEMERYLFHDGPAPAVLEQLPELQSVAALERARQRAKSSPPPA